MSRRRRRGSVAGIVTSALIFGVVAGGTMVSVNNIAGNYLQAETAVESSSIGNVSEDAFSRLTSTEDSTSVLTANTDDSSSSSDSSSNTVSDIVKQAMPSVVSITNTIQYQLNGYSMFGQGSNQTAEAAASGSGVIIGKNETELLIVTNHHVVEDATSLSVQFVDGESVEAEIKGISNDADIALIAVSLDDISGDTMNAISIATFGDSDDVLVGDQVVAIGNALGYGQSVTTGIISAKDREITTSDGTESGLLQTDAAINPGNSGGALLNMDGELIGINVAKYASEEVEGMGYSIPSSQVSEIVAELSERTTRSKVDVEDQGTIGIQAKTVDSQTAETFDMPQGVYVYKIIEGGAAENSTLQEKDIIIAFDGQSVASMDELTSLLQRYSSGETVEITVKRLSAQGEYEEKTVEITLGSKN